MQKPPRFKTFLMWEKQKVGLEEIVVHSSANREKRKKKKKMGIPLHCEPRHGLGHINMDTTGMRQILSKSHVGCTGLINSSWMRPWYFLTIWFQLQICMLHLHMLQFLKLIWTTDVMTHEYIAPLVKWLAFILAFGSEAFFNYLCIFDVFVSSQCLR